MMAELFYWLTLLSWLAISLAMIKLHHRLRGQIQLWARLGLICVAVASLCAVSDMLSTVNVPHLGVAFAMVAIAALASVRAFWPQVFFSAFKVGADMPARAPDSWHWLGHLRIFF